MPFLPPFPSAPASPVPVPQADMIIVIHPGSLYLRIGRACDLHPQCILHAIARRRKINGKVYRENILPPWNIKDKDSLKKLEESRLQVSHSLQSCIQSDGRKRYATPPQQIAAFNRRSLPEIIGHTDDWFHPTSENVFDELILEIDPIGEYNVHFPIRRGKLNLHSDIGGSLNSVINDLKDIWEYVLQEKLNINLSELEQYKAVLIIPDIYNRSHLKELMQLLLLKMGFGGCFLIQDHVAATFGAGLGYACVVDVGDQKTSVSCVEDGMSHPNTRVCLEYGGADVTQTFYWLLKKSSFPYKECNDELPQDSILLRTLKEQFCHIDLDICGSDEKVFELQQPGKPMCRYTLQVADECILAPLGLFYTELLGVTGTSKAIVIQKPCSEEPDPEDCFDAEYLRETGRRGGREQLEQNQMDNAGNNQLNNDNNDDDIVVDTLEFDREIKPFVKEFDQIIGLDQAVLQSIERCPNDEIKRKMYGCILVVGGGTKFDGIGKWLQNRVSLQIPYLYRPEHLDIVTSPKDMDPSMTSWKGAAVMSCLESASELWIYSYEYESSGLRILREKSLFMW